VNFFYDDTLHALQNIVHCWIFNTTQAADRLGNGFSHAPICCNEIRFEVILPEYHLTTGEFLTLTPSLGWSTANIAISNISLKLEALGYISVAESLGISSTTFTQCALKTTEVAEITHKKGHYAVQGHSRSPILIPIEGSSTTSYKWLILTYLPSCTVSEIRPSIGPKSLYFATPLVFNSPGGGVPWDDLRKNFQGCQWMVKVPNAVGILPKIWTAWVGRTNVTDDRQTDGRATANSEREREFTFANDFFICYTRLINGIGRLIQRWKLFYCSGTAVE